jgi:carbon dioxide concentrating mechanism protein CcmK
VTIALGMIEVLGIPTAMEVADVMCKGASVMLVGFENTDFGRITVLIRGAVAEVQAAVTAGLEAIAQVNGGELLSHHIIARPHENLEPVLGIGMSRAIAHTPLEIRFPPPLSA